MICVDVLKCESSLLYFSLVLHFTVTGLNRTMKRRNVSTNKQTGCWYMIYIRDIQTLWSIIPGNHHLHHPTIPIHILEMYGEIEDYDEQNIVWRLVHTTSSMPPKYVHSFVACVHEIPSLILWTSKFIEIKSFLCSSFLCRRTPQSTPPPRGTVSESEHLIVDLWLDGVSPLQMSFWSIPESALWIWDQNGAPGATNIRSLITNSVVNVF